MLPIISSTAKTQNALVAEVPRRPDEDNLAWCQRVLPRGDEAAILLVGGRSPVSFRLRAAQSYIRHDLLPSYWSHAMLLGKSARDPGKTPVHEIPIEPPAGFGFPPPTNGVQTSRLACYRNPAEFPNICLLTVPVALSEVLGALARFQRQRAVLDGVDLLVRWLAYAWGVTHSGNPLLENHGLPSAAMLEVVFGAAGFDLTPGLESRASCPEAIWQAAKWWNEHYEKQERRPLSGSYCCEHAL